MNPNLTDVTVVLDRSGSMIAVADDTIGGYDQFVKDQAAAPGECVFTLVQFDTQQPHELVYSAVPVGKVPSLRDSFTPRGGTPLLDAIGATIVETGERLKAVPGENRPFKVIFVIITDGDENASREYTKPAVAKMITHQSEVYGWEFVFLGANQDAIKTGGELGVSRGSTMSYAANNVGTQAAFASTSRAMRATRSGASASLGYSDEDRDTQRKAGARE